MKYNLFCSDFDGTLVRSDGTVSENVMQEIARYTAAGGIFCVVTGRMLSSILPRVRALGFSQGLVVAYQGGMIADIQTGEVLFSKTFSCEEALEIVSYLEESGRHIHVYTKEGLFASRRDEALEIYENLCGVKAEIPKAPLSHWLAAKDCPVYKVLVMEEEEKKGALLLDLKNKFGGRHVVTTSNKWLVELTPRGADKGSAVNYLAQRFGIPKEQIACIGDALNDMPLLQAAGGKFTVQNAMEELKQIAAVMPSCEEDGVAYALKYAMGEEL